MKMLVALLLSMSTVLLSGSTASQVPKSKTLKCGVCRALVAELHYEMESVDPRRKIDVGSFQLQSDGNQKTTQRLYAGSETHMMDVLENVCLSMKDYVQAKLKKNGNFEVIALMSKSGGMNPNFGDYDLIQDPDLNKGVQYHCESIVEDYEEQIIAYFGALTGELPHGYMEKSKSVFCEEKTDVCEGMKEEL